MVQESVLAVTSQNKRLKKRDLKKRNVDSRFQVQLDKMELAAQERERAGWRQYAPLGATMSSNPRFDVLAASEPVTDFCNTVTLS